MITSDRMAMVDRNAEALGIPRRQLMESSGNAVAREVRTVAEEGDRVCIVAGRGNNGGDAFVAARFLDDFEIHVLLIGRPSNIATDIARANWDALVGAEYAVESIVDSAALELPTCDVIVDGMLGTGIAGAMREPEATVARTINETEATVVSIDVPSGMDADTGDAAGEFVRADRVVTFHRMKPGLRDLEAPVRVADIGIPQTAEILVERGDLGPNGRDPESHKGDHGEILVVGGGPYTGAPALSAQAALRGGADLVRVACPETIADRVTGFSENLIVRPFDGPWFVSGRVDEVVELAVDHDVTVIGPGLGDADPTLAAVRAFLEVFEGTAVVDADALQVVPEVETDATLICTPHRGELRKMGGPSSFDWREGADELVSFADELGHVLLVKGRYDLITDGSNLRVNRTGNPGMTVGGTGDVLAGVTAALAVNRPPLQAAAVGAFVAGRAGDLVFDDRGSGLLATDLFDAIPTAIRGD